MIRPALTNYVIGNRPTLAATCCLTAFVLFRWGMQEQHREHISWIIPAVALLMSKASFAARKRVVAYRNWREAWDEMAGAAAQPTQQTPSQRKRVPFAWRLVGFTTWLALLCWLIPHSRENTNEAALFALAWLLLSLWGAVAAVKAFARWVFSPAKAKAAASPRRERGAVRNHIVSVCLKVPWISPSLPRIRARLPDYCQPLLLTRASAPPEQTPSPPT